MQRKEFKHQIISHIGILGDEGQKCRKEINCVSWNDQPAQLEIRLWKHENTEEGQVRKALKGLKFTQDELIKLRDILNRMHFGSDSDRNYEVEHSC